MRPIEVVAVASASFFAASAALAQPDPPRRKSGLWQISVTTQGQGRAMRFQECVDQK